MSHWREPGQVDGMAGEREMLCIRRFVPRACEDKRWTRRRRDAFLRDPRIPYGEPV